MLDWLQSLGKGALNLFERLGRGHLFLLRVLVALPSLLFRLPLVVTQLYSVGVLSMTIIVISEIGRASCRERV